MAIQKQIIDRFGTTHSTAYAMIGEMRLLKTSVELHILIYGSASARSEDNEANIKVPIVEETWVPTDSDYDTYFKDSVLVTDTKSPLKQGYAYIKTQDALFNIDFTTGTTDV